MKIENGTSKMVVDVDKWLLFGCGRLLLFTPYFTLFDAVVIDVATVVVAVFASMNFLDLAVAFFNLMFLLDHIVVVNDVVVVVAVSPAF